MWHHYSYSISNILVAKASSAQIPRQGHPTVRLEFCSYRRVAVTAVSFTTIPPGLIPGYKMSIVQSTLDCYFVPTVLLHPNVVNTVLVTSTWWLSLTVDHFCFAKFENLQCTKLRPLRFMYPRFLRCQAWTPLFFARIWIVYNTVFPLSASHITKRHTGSSIQLFASSSRKFNWNNPLEKNQHETHTFDCQ